jgi:hypothetical protein
MPTLLEISHPLLHNKVFKTTVISFLLKKITNLAPYYISEKKTTPTRTMSRPHFGRVGGWLSHSRNRDLGVRWDSQNFRVQSQGSKHLTLRRSSYDWKAIKIYMSKMGSYEPFGHLQHKLCQKERSGVKLAIWLSTTKSQELTQPRCV